jgi:hypothetical protein
MTEAQPGALVPLNPKNDRHCEKRSDEAIHAAVWCKDGLLRSARNDDSLLKHLGKASDPMDEALRGV